MFLIISLLITGLFFILGIVFSRGKGAFLIAGYNTASPAEKAEYDEKKLCKAMSKLMFALAGCLFLMGLSQIWGMVLFWIGLPLFLFVSIGGVIYMNTGNRCKK